MVAFGYVPDASEASLMETHTEEQVFSLLFGGMAIREGLRVCSPLRADRNPGCTFRAHGGRLYFVDFGDTVTHRDCFEMLRDGLGLGSRDEAVRAASRLLAEGEFPRMPNARAARARGGGEGGSEIFIRPRGWMRCDREFWAPYGVGREQLEGDGVIPLTEYYVRGSRIHDVYGIAYAYTNLSNGRIKLYFPGRRGLRFMGNANRDSVGLVNGCRGSDTLTVTKSYKDARVLANAGLRAVWLQNEGMVPGEEALGGMLEGCRRVLLVFDNDAPGERAVGRVREALQRYRPVRVGEIPKGHEGVKDAADFRKAFGARAMAELAHGWLNGD